MTKRRLDALETRVALHSNFDPRHLWVYRKRNNIGADRDYILRCFSYGD